MSDTRKIVLLYEEGGKQQGGVFDLNNVQPLAGFIEQTPIGPFKLEAQLANPQNPEEISTVDMICCMTSGELHVMFEAMPLFAMIDVRLQPGVKTTKIEFAEPEDVDTDMTDTLSLMLNAKHFQHGDMFYFRFKGRDDIITTVWSDTEQKLFSVPFYNFHTDGSSCLGDACQQFGANNFSLLLSLLNAYTTPHVTFEGDGMFDIEIETPEPTKDIMRAKDIRKAVLEGKAKAKIVYTAGGQDWPHQSKIGAWVPPVEMQTPEARKKLLGKITPLLQ